MFQTHECDDSERICIDPRDNICSVCCKPFNHTIRYSKKEDTPDGMKISEFITAHAGCRSLIRKKQEHEKKILELEWQIFQLVVNEN